MLLISSNFYAILLFIIITACQEKPEKKARQAVSTIDSIQKKAPEKDTIQEKKKEPFVLNEDNAIPFFFEYAKKHKENKVKISTRFGSFVVELYDRTPYHRANFIYLTKKGYFNGSYFHRVVKDFIIQGGNADNKKISEKRKAIGRYLLPPDTRKGYKHHRGTISMPSSDIDNPHKLASPYEFFIVVKKPGSYHLDDDYTAFGRVIQGMEVVDKINAQPTDAGEWPLQNIVIDSVTIVEQ
ncbi:peptidylprolyl isomerase [Leptobacterium sp. I13]|uniref:peptidylprolyl isomerase n=1 Tax=Leptobacterium meishanense TaxID=3128904 RepID=UPI0030EB2F2B